VLAWASVLSPDPADTSCRPTVPVEPAALAWPAEQIKFLGGMVADLAQLRQEPRRREAPVVQLF
jgi:hypothetical protein